MKLKDQVVLASRERPEIDLPAYLGKYEFSVVSTSMFSHDGTIHLASDKSSVLHRIEKVVELVLMNQVMEILERGIFLTEWPP